MNTPASIKSDRSPSSQTRPAGRAGLKNGLLVGVALALLGWAIWTNRVEINQVLQRPLDPVAWASAFGIYFVGLILTFSRWHTLVRALELPFAYRDALRLGFIGNVFNLVIPGAVGGDVIKGAFFCREQTRKRNTRAIASIVMDRILGLTGLFLLGALAGAWGWSAAAPQTRLVILSVVLMLGCGFIVIAIMFTPTLFRPINRRLQNRPRLQGIVVELEFMASCYRKRLPLVFGMLAVSAFIHGLNVLAFALVSRSLFAEDPNLPDFAAHFVLTPLVLFSLAIPLPFGALGVGEQVGRQLFELVGYTGGGVAMMGFRVVMYFGGFISVLVYLANLAQVRKLSHAAETLDLEHALVPDAPDPEMLAAVETEDEGVVVSMDPDSSQTQV